MGYSPSTTGTINCVLTKMGRQVLARNDGTFRITKFKLGDDEINYSLYDSANINSEDTDILSLPIFEPSTNEDTALRFPLVTMPEGTKRVAELEITPKSMRFNINAQSDGAVVNVRTNYNEDPFYIVSFSNINTSILSSIQVAKDSNLFNVSTDVTDTGVAKSGTNISSAVNTPNQWIVSANHSLQYSESAFRVTLTFNNNVVSDGSGSNSVLRDAINGILLATMNLYGQQSGVFTTVDIFGYSEQKTITPIRTPNPIAVPVPRTLESGSQNQA